MTTCAVCDASPASTGYLCEECAAGIHGVSSLFPQHVVSRAEHPLDAVLLDRWGRAHPLSGRTRIGREVEGEGISILEASVSRIHAEVVHKRDGTWWIVDLVSSNGTTLDEAPVSAATLLPSKCTLFVGQVGLYFMTSRPAGPPVPIRVPTTQRPSPVPASEGRPPVQLPPLYDNDEDSDEPVTFMGLREVNLTLASPTGGGGGMIELDGREARLTAVQYEFMCVLAERMYSEEHRDERIRGFVRSSELLGTLPWDTGRPEDNHIKQLVRRVRRALVRAQMGDLVESRHGFGYRLRVRPSQKPVRE
jgi:hypothetical protein